MFDYCREMDSISLSTGSKSDNSQRETAEHIWKMLDELAISDPDSYNSFIKKTLSDVPPSLRSGAPTSSVKPWKEVKVACAHPVAKFLVLKFQSDLSVSIDNDTQLPVKSNWVPKLESNNLLVTIALSSKLISSLEKKMEALSELILFVCIQVEKSVGLKCQPDRFEVLEQSELPKPANLPGKRGGDITLPQNASNVVFQNSQNQKNAKVLIEELSSSSVSGNLPVPDFHFEVQNGCIQYHIELPMLECLSEYDLTLDEDSLSLSIPDLYQFRHKHGLSVDSDQVTAKFLRKRKVLKIVIPVLWVLLFDYSLWMVLYI